MHVLHQNYAIHVESHLQRVCYLDDCAPRVEFFENLQDAPSTDKGSSIHDYYDLGPVQDHSYQSQFFGEALRELFVRLLDIGLEPEFFKSFKIFPDADCLSYLIGLFRVVVRVSPF